jgi:hypothetical protein
MYNPDNDFIVVVGEVHYECWYGIWIDPDDNQFTSIAQFLYHPVIKRDIPCLELTYDDVLFDLQPVPF